MRCGPFTVVFTSAHCSQPPSSGVATLEPHTAAVHSVWSAGESCRITDIVWVARSSLFTLSSAGTATLWSLCLCDSALPVKHHTAHPLAVCTLPDGSQPACLHYSPSLNLALLGIVRGCVATYSLPATLTTAFSDGMYVCVLTFALVRYVFNDLHPLVRLSFRCAMPM